MFHKQNKEFQEFDTFRTTLMRVEQIFFFQSDLLKSVLVKHLGSSDVHVFG